MAAGPGRKLGILSDARYRFERGLDPESGGLGRRGGGPADRRALRRRGQPRGERRHAAGHARTIALRPVAGRDAGRHRGAGRRTGAILEALGFETGAERRDHRLSGAGLAPDVEGEACLVEEVLRIHGYDHIPQTGMTLDTTLPLPALSVRQRRQARWRARPCPGTA